MPRKRRPRHRRRGKVIVMESWSGEGEVWSVTVKLEEDWVFR